MYTLNMSKDYKDERSYEEMREDALLAFSKIYKDSLAFDLAGIPKEARIKMIDDEFYLSSTKRAKADMYAKQLRILGDVIEGQHSDPDKGNATEILKALEMRNKLLFNDLNIEADDSNALNIYYLAMNRDDFEKMGTVEINLQNANSDDTVSLDDDEPELPVMPKKIEEK